MKVGNQFQHIEQYIILYIICKQGSGSPEERGVRWGNTDRRNADRPCAGPFRVENTISEAIR